MVELNASKTHAYLKEVFAADAQSYVRLSFFAQRADEEGRTDIATALRSMAEGELKHAFGHFAIVSQAGDPITDLPLGSTELDLEAAMDTLNYDCSGHFQWLIRMALDEELNDVAEWFEEVVGQKSRYLEELRSF